MDKSRQRPMRGQTFSLRLPTTGHGLMPGLTERPLSRRRPLTESRTRGRCLPGRFVSRLRVRPAGHRSSRGSGRIAWNRERTCGAPFLPSTRSTRICWKRRAITLASWAKVGRRDSSATANCNPAGPVFKSFDHFLKSVPPGKPWCFWYGSHDPHRPYIEGQGTRGGINPDEIKVPHSCLMCRRCDRILPTIFLPWGDLTTTRVT